MSILPPCVQDIKQSTGYDGKLVEAMWEKYGIPNSIQWAHFVQALAYIHLYPTRRQSSIVLGCSASTLQETVLPHLITLANMINEIRWDDRLNPFNHTPDFPYLFTGMVDTFPIEVEKPEHRELRRALFTNKYGTTVYKVQLGVSFLGQILFCTGPHLPLYDAHIWEATAHDHPREEWEWWLGDGHYSTCRNMLTPWRKDRVLSEDEMLANTIISFYRARVEHVNAVLVNHNMFRGVYRGGIHVLEAAVAVTAHMSAAHLRKNIRYPLVGPWPHHTAQ